MLRIPDRPENRKGEDSIRTGFQRKAGTVQRRQQGKLPALLETGGEDDKNQIRYVPFKGLGIGAE